MNGEHVTILTFSPVWHDKKDFRWILWRKEFDGSKIVETGTFCHVPWLLYFDIGDILTVAAEGMCTLKTELTCRTRGLSIGGNEDTLHT